MAKIDGLRLRRYREGRGHSQEELAKIAGVSGKTVARAESTGVVHPATLRLLAKALEVSIPDLLVRAGVRIPNNAESTAPDPGPVANLPGSASNVGRIIVTLDGNSVPTLNGLRLEEFFQSVLALLHAGFGVELRLATPGEAKPNEGPPDRRRSGDGTVVGETD